MTRYIPLPASTTAGDRLAGAGGGPELMRLVLRDAHVGSAEEKVKQNIFRFFFLFFLPVIFFKLLFSCGMQAAGTSVHVDGNKVFLYGCDYTKNTMDWVKSRITHPILITCKQTSF